MPTTTGNHPLTYPVEGATGWYATYEAYAQALSDYLDDLGVVGITQIRDTNANEMVVFATTASAVNYLKLTNSATGAAVALDVDGSDTNISVNITPKGSGDVVLDGLKYPQADGTASQSLVTDGSAQLSWSTRLANVVEDTTPQLGGALDVNGQEITGAVYLHSPGDIKFELGDTVGVNKLSLLDSSSVEVASWDSNGDITAVDIAATTVTTTGLVDAKTLTINGGIELTSILDEDNLVSDSAVAIPTQQSVKAYVDALPTGDWNLITTEVTTSGTESAVTSGLGLAYEDYRIVIDDVNGGGNLTFDMSDDGGATYAVQFTGFDIDSVDSVDYKNTSSGITLIDNNKIVIKWSGNKTSDYKEMQIISETEYFVGVLKTTSDIDAIKFTAGGGFSAGGYKVYGR